MLFSIVRFKRLLHLDKMMSPIVGPCSNCHAQDISYWSRHFFRFASSISWIYCFCYRMHLILCWQHIDAQKMCVIFSFRHFSYIMFVCKLHVCCMCFCVAKFFIIIIIISRRLLLLHCSASTQTSNASNNQHYRKVLDEQNKRRTKIAAEIKSIRS